jgi:hypothetical protein
MSPGEIDRRRFEIVVEAQPPNLPFITMTIVIGFDRIEIKQGTTQQVRQRAFALKARRGCP